MNPVWVVLVAAVAGFWIWYMGRIPRPRATIRRQVVKLADAGARAVLQGGVRQLSLSEIFQYLDNIAASGILEFTSGRRTGRVEFSGGRILSARYRRQEGMEALMSLLSEEDGDFRFFRTGRPAQMTTQGLEVFDVMMSWMDANGEGAGA